MKPFFSKSIPLFFLIAVAFGMTVPSFAHAFNFRAWETTSSPVLPSSGSVANAIAVDPPYIYVAGTFIDNTGDGKMRLEKRYMSNGELVQSFGVNGVYEENPRTNDDYYNIYDNFNGIAINQGNIFLSGQYGSGYGYSLIWHVEKIDGSGNTIWKGDDYNNRTVNAIAVEPDGSHVFTGGGFPWSIEKRNGVNGTRCDSGGGANCDNKSWVGTGGYVGATQEGKDAPFANSSVLGMAAFNNLLYAVGYQSEDNFTGSMWRIEQRDTSSGSFSQFFNTGGLNQEGIPIVLDQANEGAAAYAIASNGYYFYVAGYSDYRATITKYDGSGNVERGFGATYETYGTMKGDLFARFRSIAISPDSMTIYAAGSKEVGGGDLGWFLEARDAGSGNLIWKQEKTANGKSMTNRLSSFSKFYPKEYWSTTANGGEIYGLTVDASGSIYTAGYDLIAPNSEWRIEKIKQGIDAGEPIRAAHINDLRSALDGIRSKLGITAAAPWSIPFGASDTKSPLSTRASVLKNVTAAGTDNSVITANNPIRAANILGLLANYHMIRGCVPKNWDAGITRDIPIKVDIFQDISTLIDDFNIAIRTPGFSFPSYFSMANCQLQVSYTLGATISTWTVPKGVYVIKLEMQGGGGGGGGCGAPNCVARGGNGGSGGTISRIVFVTPDDTFNIVVGERGYAGGANHTGETGGGGGGGGGATAFWSPINGTYIVGGGGGGAGASAFYENAAENDYGKGGKNGGGWGGRGGGARECSGYYGGNGGRGGFGGGGGGGGGGGDGGSSDRGIPGNGGSGSGNVWHGTSGYGGACSEGNDGGSGGGNKSTGYGGVEGSAGNNGYSIYLSQPITPNGGSSGTYVYRVNTAEKGGDGWLKIYY